MPGRFCSSAAVGTATKEFQRMAFQRKVGFERNSGEGFAWQAGLHFHDPMAARAGDMVVMTTTAHPIAMGAIAKFDPIQQTLFEQHFYGAIDRGASQPGIELFEVVPEFIGTKIRCARRQCG